MLAGPHLKKTVTENFSQIITFWSWQYSGIFGVNSRYPLILLGLYLLHLTWLILSLPASWHCSSSGAWGQPRSPRSPHCDPRNPNNLWAPPNLLAPELPARNSRVAQWHSDIPQTEQENLGMVYTQGVPRRRGLWRSENHDTLVAMRVVRSMVIQGKQGASRLPIQPMSLEQSLVASSSPLQLLFTFQTCTFESSPVLQRQDLE